MYGKGIWNYLKLNEIQTTKKKTVKNKLTQIIKKKKYGENKQNKKLPMFSIYKLLNILKNDFTCCRPY